MSTSSYLVDLHSSCRLHHTLSTSPHLDGASTSCRLQHNISATHRRHSYPAGHWNRTGCGSRPQGPLRMDHGLFTSLRFALTSLDGGVTYQAGRQSKDQGRSPVRAVWNLRASLPGLPATSHLETPSEFAADRSVACLRAVWNLRALLPGLPAMHCSSCLGDGGWWMDSWLVGGHIHGLGWCLTSHKTCLLVGGWWNTCHGYESNLLNPPALVLTCSCTHLLLYSPALVLTYSFAHLLLHSPAPALATQLPYA
jgi:hypothetical protein